MSFRGAAEESKTLPAGAWPRSREAVDLQFEGVPGSDRCKILADNTVRLYGL